MKIEIKECIMECSFNLKSFKKEFSKTWKFEDAVKRNLTITSANNVSKKDINKLICLGFDWGGLFRQLENIEQDVIRFKGYNVSLEGYKQYEPYSIANVKEF